LREWQKVGLYLRTHQREIELKVVRDG
jgi:hypothetical protein